MQRWSDLPENAKREIERKYRAGKSPVELAAAYGLKPKQISDQAYRKMWDQSGKSSGKKKTSKKKSAKKSKTSTKKTAKKSAKKSKKYSRR